MNWHNSTTRMLFRVRSASGYLHSVALEKTTVTRQRDDYNGALVKFREAQEAAAARGEVVTQSIPRKDRVRQRGA